MGRFKAGDRVKILAGHPYHAGRVSQGEEMTGVIKNDGGKVERRRGKYLVEVDGGFFDDYSFKGRELELIVDAPAANELQIGDRVRFVEDYGRTRTGDEGVITGFWDANTDPKGGVVVDLDKGGTPNCYAERVEKIEPGVEAPAVAAPVTTAWVGAGKTYFDTDGRSVGPMIAYLDGFIEVAGDGRMWNPDGSAVNEHPALVAPLTLEVGRFYKTRDGRKVGPVSATANPWKDMHGDVAAFESGSNGLEFWTANGGYLTRYGKDHKDDIVAEWVEPVAEPAPVVLPTAEVNVGDRVWDVTDSGEKWMAGTVRTVREDGQFQLTYDDGDTGSLWWTLEEWGHHQPVDEIAPSEAAPTPIPTPYPVTPTGSFIVARLTAKGEPRPNVRPRVHASIETAEAEAQRLADRLGDEFAVYQQVSSKTVDAGPVPTDFDLAQARLTETHKGAVQSAFVWAGTKQGHGFWRDQGNTGLTHLGRAILKKWIAEAEAAAKEAA